jgi:superoxide dismutase, Fe-Mn family
MDRRNLLKHAGAVAGLAVTSASPLSFLHSQNSAAPAANPNAGGPFVLPPLPYAYDSLEPFIDAETMHLHHDKHHAGYVDKLNAAVAAHPELSHKTLDELLTQFSTYPESYRAAVQNQGGGHANHSFWWPTLGKAGGTAPKAELAKDIDAQFGSAGKFQEQIAKASVGVFGSGWGWLTLDPQGKLRIETSPNQDSPITAGRTPILGIDVWEHAYYLKYNNRRADYVQAFFNIVNWDYVSGQYSKAKASQHA